MTHTPLFPWSNGFFNVASVLYALAFVTYAWQLASTKKAVSTAASTLGRLAFLGHTTALILRWCDSGIAQPPWTNLYESLVFFSWGVMGVHIFLEYRYKFKLTGVFAVGTTFAAMGVASLHPNKSIEPLVPALQSWWLLFHVFMACIAYAFFLGSSFFSVFFLLKDKVKVEVLAGWAALVCAFFLCIAAGKSFFLHGSVDFYKVTQMNGQDVIMNFKGADGKKVQQFVTLPGATYTFAILIFLYLSSAALLLTQKGKAKAELWGKRLFGAAVTVHFALLIQILVGPKAVEGFYLKSNPYRLAAIGMTMALGAFYVFLFKWGEKLTRRLPDTKSLDRWSYETILIGVPFMTINLISGAVWAYYAWGRYWGWDPKETWALITWMTYLIYLHTRILGGWSGRKSAVISIAGFFVVIFTYLGVNLVISGLHSYATG